MGYFSYRIYKTSVVGSWEEAEGITRNHTIFKDFFQQRTWLEFCIFIANIFAILSCISKVSYKTTLFSLPMFEAWQVNLLFEILKFCPCLGRQLKLYDLIRY